MTDFALAITRLVETNYFQGKTLRHNGAVVSTYADLYIEDDDTGVSLKPDEATLTTAYNAQLALETAKTSNELARKITSGDIKTYLFNQLVSASPSVPTIYSNIKPFVDGNAKVLNAVNNTISLYNLADGTTIDVNTNAGKAKYLRAVLHVLSLLG